MDMTAVSQKTKQKPLSMLATVLAVLAVLALSALGLAGGFELTENQHDTGVILAAVCGCSILWCFVVGELSNNNSQMDKLWSILPVVYMWIIAVCGGLRPRLIAAALIVTAWGIRLTVNFARKGAYRLKFWTGEEDYRWSIVRQNPVFRHRFAWALFDLFFICFYQNVLVLAICMPALACIVSDVPFGRIDAAAVVCAVFFLVLETVSDELQWKFHQTKKSLLAGGKTLGELPAPYDLGFNTLGLWSYMRHPNYLGEQGLWLSLYGLAVGAGAAHGGILHWSVVGPLFLVLLFIGSSSLGESISSGKYPRYAEYVSQVFKYLPLKKYKPAKRAE